ncbi:MAG TPA: hypothetical protein VGA22_07465 [Gemmatimonadales bacterium]
MSTLAGGGVTRPGDAGPRAARVGVGVLTGRGSKDEARPAAATDLQRRAVLEASEATHEGRVGTATRLGVKQLMEELEIRSGDPTEARGAR